MVVICYRTCALKAWTVKSELEYSAIIAEKLRLAASSSSLRIVDTVVNFLQNYTTLYVIQVNAFHWEVLIFKHEINSRDYYYFFTKAEYKMSLGSFEKNSFK